MAEQANELETRKQVSSARSPRVLVVDDESDACETLRRVLEIQGYSATPETSALSALEKVGAEDFDLVLTDVSMTEMNGLELCRHIRAKRPRLPVIMLTGKGSMTTAIAALRLGASDFLTKPLDAAELARSLARALRPPEAAEPSASTTQAVGEPDATGQPISSQLAVTGSMGESPPIRQLYQLIENLSESVASVIIQGETGTGKEVIARMIHSNSRLKHGPFVAVNCAAIPAGLLESELFGNVRGAFTGARTARTGLIVQATGGTLLLDEIGELPLAMQPKLLRALQERKVRAVGGSVEVAFDCRVIAATNRDLDLEVSEKRFRKDLYYRLDVVRLTVPPLRERAGDILLLARYFLRRLAKADRPPATLAAVTAQKLLSYPWPGNVRELENCMERAVTLARGAELGVEDLPDRIRLVSPPEWPAAATAPIIESLHALERRHILQTIESLGGNKTLAAERLGIDRSTLYRRLEEYEAARSS